jgi:ABC-type transport system involved in multi-copper enzyme maturation permease subunit
MSSNAITEKEQRVSEQSGGIPGGPWRPGSDLGPSRIREDEPALPRTLGMIGAALVIFGGMALAFNMYGRSVRVGSGWSILFLAFGLAGLLFHAAFDRDVQFRRMYLFFGCAIFALGVLLCVFPSPKVGALFRYGVPCIILALLFLVAFLRNETEAAFRNIAQQFLGGGGALMALAGLIGGTARGEFFLPYGVVLALLGLVYVVAFVATRGLSDDLAYGAAVGLAAVGLLVVAIALGRSFFTADGSRYFVAYGSLFVFVGLLYSAAGGGLASDAPLFVLTRRELGAFFFSPIAYLVLLGFSCLSWIQYWLFLRGIVGSRNIFEPIVAYYFVDFFPVMTVIFIVPVITMRLLSEEQRTGTLEVLLTAPVDESVIVFSKFLGALISYLVIWIPFFLYLLALPLSGANPFDYRPLLSFLITLIITGASFVSMGLFFSSLTRSQVASGVLTFAGMALLSFTYFAVRFSVEDSNWHKVLTHMSYIHLWINTLEGKITPLFLLFPISMTILFLFLTVKVLESRKWR